MYTEGWFDYGIDGFELDIIGLVGQNGSYSVEYIIGTIGSYDLFDDIFEDGMPPTATFLVKPVPLPAAFGLLLAGLFGLGAVSRSNPRLL